MSRLDGQVAIVTGAARGIGRVYAHRLASLGAHVTVVDVNLDAAQEFGEELTAESVIAELEGMGVDSIGVQADLTKRDDVEAMTAAVLERFGRIDVVVNNAGGAISPIERSWATQFTDEDYQRVFDLNLRSAILVCQAVSPIMRKQGSGSIVNVGSMAALDPSKRNGLNSVYGTAKAALTQYTKYLAAEIGPDGVRANVLSPGTIGTSRIRALSAQRGIGGAADFEHIPLRRQGTEEDCAGVVEFLATDLSAYVTGQCISVDGGWVLTPS